MVLVSVVIPVFNQEQYVGDAIDSVLAQTFQGFEVIVVDDGSTDGTPDVLERFGSRIRVIRQTNRGGAAAVNAGIHHAHGQWIALLSADDAWEPAKLEKQVQVIRRNPNVGIVYTDYLYVDAKGATLSREHFPLPPTRRQTSLRLIRRCFMNGSSTLIRSDVFERIGVFDEGDRLTPDWDFFLRAALAFDFAHVPDPLVRYHIHSAQTSAKREKMERASRRTMSRNLRRMGPFLGTWAALVVFRKQIRSFPAFTRASVGHGRTIRRQLIDVIEWLAILVNPATTWTPIRGKA